MGDMADFLIDNADWEHEGLEWDEYEDLPYTGPREPQPKRCKYCGEYPLYWYNPWPHHWRLRHADGTPHKCDHSAKTGRLMQSLKRRFK